MTEPFAHAEGSTPLAGALMPTTVQLSGLHAIEPAEKVPFEQVGWSPDRT